MDTSHLIFLSLDSRVVAVNKHDGQIAWSIALPGFFGDGFVTLQADETQVYAFCKGRLHCLDPFTGHLLWTNELKGYGYDYACICVPGRNASAPPLPVLAKMEADRRKERSSESSSSSPD